MCWHDLWARPKFSVFKAPILQFTHCSGSVRLHQFWDVKLWSPEQEGCQKSEVKAFLKKFWLAWRKWSSVTSDWRHWKKHYSSVMCMALWKCASSFSAFLVVFSSDFNFEKNGGKDEKRGGGLKISAWSLNILWVVSTAAWNVDGVLMCIKLSSLFGFPPL